RAWLHAQLAHEDALPARQLERNRIAALIGVVRLGAVAERMDQRLCIGVGLRDFGADPESLAAGIVWDRNAARAEVRVGLACTLEHRERGSRAGDVDERAVAALPLNVCCTLRAKQQAIAAEACDLGVDREPLV